MIQARKIALAIHRVHVTFRGRGMIRLIFVSLSRPDRSAVALGLQDGSRRRDETLAASGLTLSELSGLAEVGDRRLVQPPPQFGAGGFGAGVAPAVAFPTAGLLGHIDAARQEAAAKRKVARKPNLLQPSHDRLLSRRAGRTHLSPMCSGESTEANFVVSTAFRRDSSRALWRCRPFPYQVQKP